MGKSEEEKRDKEFIFGALKIVKSSPSLTSIDC
jgi:hypothetical protein